MKNSEVLETVAGTQQIVLDGFSKADKTISRLPNWINYLKQINNTPNEVLSKVLGETGIRLKNFTSRVNMEHPDLETFHEGLSEVYRSASDLITSAKVDSDLGKEIKCQETTFLNDNRKNIIRSLMQPKARLLASAAERDDSRGVKKQVSAINLKDALTEGENSYYSCPSDFKRYAYNSKHFMEEMKLLAAREETFLKYNMREMADVYHKRMRSIEESLETLCGFYRLNLSQSALILAKMHNFSFSENGAIQISSKYFGDYNFWLEKKESATGVEEVKRTILLNTRFTPLSMNQINFRYQARMYPLAKFNRLMSTSVKTIIDKTENFSSFGNNSFFDYYWLVVPSINVTHPVLQKQDKFVLKNGSDELTFDTAEEAAFHLDYELVMKNFIYPAVVGERDGKCYFICMFGDK